MASSSQAATCNGDHDASNTVEEDEIAMWIRLQQVAMDIRANGVAQIEAIEERRIRAAVSSRASILLREAVIKYITSMKDNFVQLKSVDFEISNDVLKRLEGQQEASMTIGPLICLLLSSLVVFDIQRKWESRFLELFWKCSTGISDADLLLFLSKFVEHYSPSHEVDNLEDFMFTNEGRATFLNDCTTFDKTTRLAMGFNEFSLHQTQGQKPQHWTRRDHTLHSMSSFSKSVKPLELIFPFSARFETAKECLARLDLLKSVTVDLNPDESDTLARVCSSKSPELQALHALKKEMELHKEVALHLEQLSGKHLHAFETMSEDRQDEFFRTCQEERSNVVQEALYKKVKCLASIKKASVDRQVKLSSEDLLKWILQKAGSVFKEVEGKLKKARSSESEANKECSLCYLEFSKKRKRACLDPCGHASACIDCATKAWARKPYCPWCKARIEKPISIPAQIFL